MSDYSNYEVEDFILDNSFSEWVLTGAEEQDQFWRTWLLEHPDRRAVIEQACLILLSIDIPSIEELSEADIHSLIDRVNRRQQETDIREDAKVPLWKSPGRAWLRVAAVLLVLIAAWILLYRSDIHFRLQRKPVHTVEVFRETINETSDPVLIRLADGTSAILKPGSRLRYPESFTENRRQVYLEGEAFFEVHHNPEKPFLVHSGTLVTRVLGTSFWVRTPGKEKSFRVIVTTGIVTVYKEPSKNARKKDKPVMLVPNQQVTYRVKSGFIKKTLPVPSMLSPGESRRMFTFNETPLSEVISILEKAYGVKIVYDKEKLGSCPLTATLYDQPLYEKIRLICQALKVHFTVSRGVIVIDGRACSLSNSFL